MSGYRNCACPDCFEIAIGEAGAMCDECEKAGCDGESDCESPYAYGGDAIENFCKSCGAHGSEHGPDNEWNRREEFVPDTETS